MAYKKNYLSKVIARIDFLNPIKSIDAEIPKDLSVVIKELYPVIDEQDKKIIDDTLEIGLENIKRTTIIRKEWNFYKKGKEQRLAISNKYMLIEFKTFNKFKELEDPFLKIIDVLFKCFPDELQINRLGLRFINNLELPVKNPIDWKTYLDKKLLSIFDIPSKEDKIKIARAFHSLIINYDTFILNFQYGMHNPDFPAPIKEKLFILDYDAYYTGLLDQEYLKKNFILFYKKTEELFESSITPNLRKRMDSGK